jgi:23S rRNA (cytosine1962-C5)-methyltransferase
MDPRLVAARLLAVLYEDEHFLAVNKPPGIYVFPEPGGHKFGLLDALIDLRAHPPEGSRYQPGDGRLFAVNAVDVFSSGVVLLAKGAWPAEQMVKLFQQRRVRRTYQCILGEKPRESRMEIAGSIVRVGPNRFRVGQNADGQADTRTSVRVVKSGPERVMVSCVPVGDELHQLRVHLASMKTPLLNDREYHKFEPERQVGRVFEHLAELSFEHPAQNQELKITSRTPLCFDWALEEADLLEDHLSTALALRMQLLLDRSTSAYRLFSGKHEGVPGLVGERYGDIVIMQTHQGKFEGGNTRAKQAATRWQRMLGLSAVYHKFFPVDRSHTGQPDKSLTDPRPIVGERTDKRLAVMENDLTFLIKPFDGFATGIFLDQRGNRQRLRSLARGKSVLNLFAYTCGFSVAAAAGAAESTTSVDLSKKNLEWGKENFTANGLPLEGHWFIASEVFDYFERARRQNRSFDLIIIDPPSFARSKKPKRVFTLTKDFVGLLSEALSILRPGGYMLISINHRRLPVAWLREQVESAAGDRRVEFVETPKPGLDFENDPSRAKSILVRFP